MAVYNETFNHLDRNVDLGVLLRYIMLDNNI